MRGLYDYVGEPWHWIDRNVFDDDRWETTISAPGYRHITCVVGGVPVGYCEYELQGSSVEITYFGLGTDVHGHGLGGWFLTEHSTTDSRSRVWSESGFHLLLDGPHARTNYEARGMRVFDTEVEWKMLR